MTLRHALLAALTLGEQYGLQLHDEVVARSGRSAPLNVGQVYATLDRWVRADAVQVARNTGDGLTLYGLTESGRALAEEWLETPMQPLSWEEMREQILVASTLPGRDPNALIEAYRSSWAAAGFEVSDLGHRDALRGAALEWLRSLSTAEGRVAVDARRRPLGSSRPRRGRRPAA